MQKTGMRWKRDVGDNGGKNFWYIEEVNYPSQKAEHAQLLAGIIISSLRKEVKGMPDYPDWVTERFGDDIPDWAEDRWGSDDDDDDDD